MRRSPRVILAWAAALVVMLATVRVVGSDLGALHRRAHSLGSDVPVVLAARDLPLGTTLTVGDLSIVRRPSSTVSSDAVRDPRSAVGRVVAVAVLRGDVIGARHLVAGGRTAGSATGIGAIVPLGQRAVHVVVKDGFQPPIGSVVDVLATYDPTLTPGAGAAEAATVVARGARVLAVPAAARPDDTTDGSDADTGSGVTLLVTEAESRAVAFATSIGVVSLALAPAQSACCAEVAS